AYALMRFQVMALGVNPQTANFIANGYLYAWENGVYPLYDEAAPWHKPFADQFEIGPDMVKELGELLDKRWLADDVPTFYELENHFNLLAGSGPWERMKLVVVCRYFYLKQMFDPAFWSKLLSPTAHPAEASSVARPFDRQNDVYFN